MNIELHIWKNQREIEKTYKIDSYDLMWGTIEDLVETINLDELASKLNSNENNNFDLVGLVANILSGSRHLINDTLKDVFEGLTDEEIKKVKMSNLIQVATQLISSSLNTLGGLGNSSKN